MTTGLDQAVTVAKAAQAGFPIVKRIAAAQRAIRRGLATAIFPELRAAGLVATYADRRAALPDILRSMKKSRSVQILSNKGDDWLGDSGLIGPFVRLQRGQGGRPHIETILMQRALRKFRQPRPKNPGSDLVDRHLSCLSAYPAAWHPGLTSKW